MDKIEQALEQLLDAVHVLSGGGTDLAEHHATQGRQALATLRAELAGMKAALTEIAEYEGNPLTPIRNSVRKSNIARTALDRAREVGK